MEEGDFWQCPAGIFLLLNGVPMNGGWLLLPSLHPPFFRLLEVGMRHIFQSCYGLEGIPCQLE